MMGIVIMKTYKKNLNQRKSANDLFDIYKWFGIDISTICKDGLISDIRQIQANDETIKLMEKLIQKCFDKRFKGWSEKYRKYCVAVHMLEYSPKTDNNIPNNELWVYDTNEKF